MISIYFHQNNLTISHYLSHVDADNGCHYNTTGTLPTSQPGCKEFLQVTGINRNCITAAVRTTNSTVSDGHRKGTWDIGGVAPLTLIGFLKLW